MAKPGKGKKTEMNLDDEITAPDFGQTDEEATAAQQSPTIEQIQLRAYEIYLERGGSDGNDTEDWLQAERELSGTNVDQEIS
jgi:hypothetical protein